MSASNRWPVPTFCMSRDEILDKLLVSSDRDVYKMRKSLADYEEEKWEALGRECVFQRVFTLARNTPGKENFTITLTEKLKAILENCRKENHHGDKITGFFINMGTWSLVMVEGSEIILAQFFIELAKLDYHIWENSRVFDVANDIGKVLFENFYSCEMGPPVQTKEKLAPNLTEDMNKMGEMHYELLEKVMQLSTALSKKVKDKQPKGALSNRFGAPFSNEEYNSLLPEVQRMDLVMKSPFYRTILDFSKIYGFIDLEPDEEGYVWPIPFNYVPVKIFERSEYDVNLTFPDDEAGDEDSPGDQLGLEDISGEGGDDAGANEEGKKSKIEDKEEEEEDD